MFAICSCVFGLFPLPIDQATDIRARVSRQFGQIMKNRANNPMHHEDRYSYDDASPFAGGFARFGASAPTAGDGGAFDEVGAAQDRMLTEALAIGDAPSIAAALGLIARMRGMSGLAAATGIGRQNLYRTLRAEGHPTLDTVTRVTNALGYRLSATWEGGPPGAIDSGAQPQAPGPLSSL
jgi:probable addiction module antidote protein